MKAMAIPGRNLDTAVRDWAATTAATQRKLDSTFERLATLSGDYTVLVAVMSAHYPSVWSYADPTRPEVPYVHVHTNVGQLSFDIDPQHMEMFEHVPHRPGFQMIRRTREQRSELLRELAQRLADDSKMVDLMDRI